MQKKDINYGVFDAINYRQKISIIYKGINYEVAPLGSGISLTDRRKKVILCHVYGSGFPIESDYKITNSNKKFRIWDYSDISLVYKGFAKNYEIDRDITGLYDGYTPEEVVNLTPNF